MEASRGADAFHATGEDYDRFMGRYSRPLASAFVEVAGVAGGQSVLDIGCGPGALTGVLVERVGAHAVSACDPSPSFVAECAARHPGVDVRLGSAEAVPFDDASVDSALLQLVLHFVADPARAADELRRVVRPSGTVAACVWDFAEGMELLRLFWDSAAAVDPGAPDEALTRRFGAPGEITEWLAVAGFDPVRETTIAVSSTYRDFDELWSGFLAGIGPTGSFCVNLPGAVRSVLRGELFDRLGSPTGAFTLEAVARCACGRVPH